MNSDLLITLAILAGIALFTALFSWLVVRTTRRDDAQALALTSADIRERCKHLLESPDFLWALWQGRANVSKMKLLVRSSRDELLTTVAAPTIPLDGVLKRFEFEGKQYEIFKPALMTIRTCLREAGHDQVLYTAEHATLRTTFYQGECERELCVIPTVSVFARYAELRTESGVVGKMIMGLRENVYVNVLTLHDNGFSMLEKIFLLAGR